MKYPFVEFRTLDLELTPESQGFGLNTFDLVFGTNVFHATKDICASLQGAKSLLKDQGLIVLNEITRLSDFGTLTFGLTSGWWGFVDESYRIQDSPLLKVESWRKALNACGYSEPLVFGALDVAEEDQDRAVLVAKANVDINRPMLAQKSSTQTSPVNQGSFNEVKPLTTDVSAIHTAALAFVTDVFSKVLQLPVEDLSPRANFERYGVDSLMVMELTDVFKNTLGSVDSTLLFEHTSIQALADYFAIEYTDQIQAMQPRAAAVSAPDRKPESRLNTTDWMNDQGALESNAHSLNERLSLKPKEYSDAIAVVGMSCRFPGSPDLDTFWNNDSYCFLRI
jgi:aryl carrier-like protein